MYSTKQMVEASSSPWLSARSEVPRSEDELGLMERKFQRYQTIMKVKKRS
jgi:hypothetical protein